MLEEFPPGAKVDDRLLKKFHLTRSIPTSNMHLFDKDGKLKNYSSPVEIMVEFCNSRLAFYGRRKKALVENKKKELNILDNMIGFIDFCFDGECPVKDKDCSSKNLEEMGFACIPEGTEEGFDYLRHLPLCSMIENYVKWKDDREKLVEQVENLEETNPKSLWEEDLKKLEQQLDEVKICYIRLLSLTLGYM